MFNKFFAVIFFPIFFVTAYLYRIVVYDILMGVFVDLPRAFTSSIVWGLVYVIILPITVVLDVFIGFATVLLVTCNTCGEIYRGEIDARAACAEMFKGKK